MRLIDADALRQKMYHEAFETETDMQRWDSGCWIRYKLFEKVIEQAPAADVRENKHGKWIDCDVNESGLEDTVSLLCENCGNYTEFALIGTPKEVMDTMRFCPRCGAVMDGGDYE